MTKDLTVTFPKPKDSEMNRCPVWFIIAPWALYPTGASRKVTPSIQELASMFHGPFFSREEAQARLENNWHEYGQNARVYCKSGWVSDRYAAAFAGTHMA